MEPATPDMRVSPVLLPAARMGLPVALHRLGPMP